MKINCSPLCGYYYSGGDTDCILYLGRTTANAHTEDDLNISAPSYCQVLWSDYIDEEFNFVPGMILIDVNFGIPRSDDFVVIRLNTENDGLRFSGLNNLSGDSEVFGFIDHYVSNRGYSESYMIQNFPNERNTSFKIRRGSSVEIVMSAFDNCENYIGDLLLRFSTCSWLTVARQRLSANPDDEHPTEWDLTPYQNMPEHANKMWRLVEASTSWVYHNGAIQSNGRLNGLPNSFRWHISHPGYMEIQISNCGEPPI